MTSRLVASLLAAALLSASPAASHPRWLDLGEPVEAGSAGAASALTDALPASADPAKVGQWAGPFDWPLVAIHATLLRTGQVLLLDDHTDTASPHVWDPGSGGLVEAPMTDGNLYCAGHSVMPDGRVLLTGGTHRRQYVGIRNTTIFDPDTLTWTTAPPMDYSRWYPTNTTLPDTRVLVVSGTTDCPFCLAEVPEIYDPATNSWMPMPWAPLALPLYPHMFLLPDGRVLAAGSQEDPIPTLALDFDQGAWIPVDALPRDGGSSAMYRPGQIIKSGTARNPDYPPAAAAATTYVLDMTEPSPAWRQTGSMAFARTQHNLTLLPDGTVLATGGSRNSDVWDLAAAVYEAEIWSPATERWTTMAATQRPRLYHSTALLLPDGRVLVTGGGRYGYNELTAEIYSPPYLFKGPRPMITALPEAIQHGALFTVMTPDAGRVVMASLMRPGAVTHAFNMEQRFVPLPFSAAGRALTLGAPGDARIAPPGYYMLFLVDTSGVPSVGAFVRLDAPASGALTLGAPRPGAEVLVDAP